MTIYRLNLTKEEHGILLDAVGDFGLTSAHMESLLRKVEAPIMIRRSTNKQRAAKRASEARSDMARKKIEAAINILRLEGRAMTVYSVSKEAGVAFQTAQKYEEFILSQNKGIG